MLIPKKDKRAESMTGWFQGVLLTLLIVAVIGIAILGGSGSGGLNDMYGKNYSTGISTSAIDSFTSTINNGNDLVNGGEVEQTNSGLSLTQTWSVTKGIFSLLASFFTGSFLYNLLVNILGFPSIVGSVIQILFLGSLILLIVRLFMKIKP